MGHGAVCSRGSSPGCPSEDGESVSLLPPPTRLSLNQLETGLNYSGEKAEKDSCFGFCPDLVKPVCICVYADPTSVNPWITACVFK